MKRISFLLTTFCLMTGWLTASSQKAMMVTLNESTIVFDPEHIK